MKYNLDNKTNRFAQRTLKAFSDTLFLQLKKKPFEEITVNELCTISNYPRATFYNYFEDIYDLLDYCWLSLSKVINLDDYKSMIPEERLFQIFERIFSFLNNNQEEILAISRWNMIDGTLSLSYQKYFRKQVQMIMESCTCTQRYPIPYEIIACHYSNTLLMLIEWCFFKNEKYTKEMANECLRYLLKEI